MDLIRDDREPRHLVLNAQKLDYGEDQVRLLLAVTDVTEARASEKLKDNLLREKAILRISRHRGRRFRAKMGKDFTPSWAPL